MVILKTIMTIAYIIICISIIVLVLMQEGKQAGLGAISGAAETYWGKNKGRSVEGALEKATKYLGAAFIIISLLMNMKWFAGWFTHRKEITTLLLL